MRAIMIFLAVCVLTAASARAHADDAVRLIVHPDTRVQTVDKKFLSDVFLKKRTRWGNDARILPVDQAPRSPIRQRFSRAVLGRSSEAVRRYWSQLVFSGRGVPPPELRSDAAVVTYVLSHPGAIGYVSSDADIGAARVVELR